MNEQDWAACTAPTRMLLFLKDMVSDRKLRLLACANGRLFWPWMTDDRSRKALIVAERFADGLASEQERTNAFASCLEVPYVREYQADGVAANSPRSKAAAYAQHAVWEHVFVGAYTNSQCVLPKAMGLPDSLPLHLLHDIFGNPFRPVILEPHWLTETVLALAGGIYADRAFDRMPILADALEDAGCDHADILTHCRGDSPHARGCWVVDLVLNKC